MNCKSLLCRGAIAVAVVFVLGLPFSSLAQNESPARKLDDITAAIQSRMNDIGQALAAAAKSLSASGLLGPNARAALSNLCGGWPDTAIYCSAIDAKGVMASVFPPKFQQYEGGDRSSLKFVSDMLMLKKPGASLPFKSMDGRFAIAYSWPVLSKNGGFIGMVNIALAPLESVDAVVKPLLGPDTSDVWILSPSGQILYSRYHGSIGDNFLITPSYATGSTLSSIVGEIAGNPSGKDSFETPPVGRSDPAERDVIWKTAYFGDVQRRIVLISGKLND